MLKHSGEGEVLHERHAVTVTTFSGVYSGMLTPMRSENAHRNLLAAIEGRAGVEFFTATAYDKASGAPCACFDIAVDAASGDGCGIYRTVILEAGVNGPFDIATPAIWCQCEGPDEVVRKVYKHLVDMEFFQNLYWYIDNAIPRHVH
ncbi:hypothetical protein B5K05_13440 [Rhizobium phaseoli]|uniref:hypothetical protein n=1 Tax=Rhizobium phaseoli TaxID=396 RepID=UPI000E0CC78A|nr:hypothetical protein [Rhizobium phaseoli]RDJ10129.1 hypothetical protein B5K04_13415 [Rhizobium phaseoli]RDJ14129.1 hypothetical protein B5K05_13440 [Rhizobium phaseoli]